MYMLLSLLNIIIKPWFFFYPKEVYVTTCIAGSASALIPISVILESMYLYICTYYVLLLLKEIKA